MDRPHSARRGSVAIETPGAPGPAPSAAWTLVARIFGFAALVATLAASASGLLRTLS